jgi:hypothetical protein
MEPPHSYPPEDAVDLSRQAQEQHQHDGADRGRHDAEQRVSRSGEAEEQALVRQGSA